MNIESDRERFVIDAVVVIDGGDDDDDDDDDNDNDNDNDILVVFPRL
jgi:hypothetical protein